MIEGNKFEKLNAPCTDEVGFEQVSPNNRNAVNPFSGSGASFFNTCIVEKSIWLPRISRLR